MTSHPDYFLVVANSGSWSHYVLCWQENGQIVWSYVDYGKEANVIAPAPDAPLTEIDVSKVFAERWPDYRVEVRRPVRPLGTYHTRIWRPELLGNEIEDHKHLTVERLGLRRALVSAQVSARLLFEQLHRVLEVIEPTPGQAGTHGHALRHLLIMACTEVESAWRSVWMANQATPLSDRLSTATYFQLCEPMRLHEWVLHLNSAPDFPPIAPFASWNADKPTQSLPWYDAYNATKHGREANLSAATLEHTLSALAAVHVMLLAQFGPGPFEADGSVPFTILERPRWSPFECYTSIEGSRGMWTHTPLFRS